MSFKFLRKKIDANIVFYGDEEPYLTIRQPEPNNWEYCFQFDDDEPVPIASGDNLTITLTPSTTANISFYRLGKHFKLFARPRQ